MGEVNGIVSDFSDFNSEKIQHTKNIRISVGTSDLPRLRMGSKGTFFFS